jgi:uncharacterized phage protein (TIGR02220 family)
MDNFVSYTDSDGNRVDELLMPYDENQRQENEVNKANASLIWNFSYIVVDAETLKLGLQPIDVLIYSFIRFYLRPEGTGKFYFTNAQIAEIFDIANDQVSRILKRLIEKGLIETKRRIRGGGGLIRFVTLRNTRTYIAENAKPLNTKYDNTELESVTKVTPKFFSNSQIAEESPTPEIPPTPQVSSLPEIALQPPPKVPQKGSPAEFIDEMNRLTGKKYRPTAKVSTAYKARLRDGYTQEEMLLAVKNASKDKFMRGENESKRDYLTPEYILRQDKLDQWLNFEPEKQKGFRSAKDILNS